MIFIQNETDIVLVKTLDLKKALYLIGNRVKFIQDQGQLCFLENITTSVDYLFRFVELLRTLVFG